MLVHINAYEAYVIIMHISLSLPPTPIHKEWEIIILLVKSDVIGSIMLCSQAGKKGSSKMSQERPFLGRYRQKQGRSCTYSIIW